ncbi:EVE domain-containing protein [Parachitinimonas caeni]|uniref:EVE domain-containing protein n=1 Tax=Parachitinimonas caeni TaxID=3031301 RepID=A0ABT7DRC9_9NEIS|nr:EVE domain-containing protein [Parachitinimonas caeni]MDK2122623.1 EVE domain-containing protein [Parachitinimonas caeni]
MNYWLMKAEPDDVGIDDLMRLPAQTVGWYGVRNYQARNFMRDDMAMGDLALFYHSGCAVPGIAGIVEICSAPYPDPTQFDPENKYFDPKSTPEVPRWQQVDVKFVRKTRFIPLSELRNLPALGSMRLLQRGNRLSITPVSEQEWHILEGLF